MKLTTLALTFAMLVLTTHVHCQDDPGQAIANEVEKELENKIVDAAQFVCEAFSPVDDDQTDPQPTKRGFFSKVWKGIKNAAVGYVVNKAIGAVIGKRANPSIYETGTNQGWRHPEAFQWWKNRKQQATTVRELNGDGFQSNICQPENQQNLEKLEQALEVLGKTTYLVQELKQCSEPGNSR